MKTGNIVAIAVKSLTILIGLPLNGWYLAEKLRIWRQLTPFHMQLVSMLSANILILVCYNSSTIVWLTTQEMLNSKYSCKLVQFAVAVAFHLLSNTFVTIAFGRYSAVNSPVKYQGPDQKRLSLIGLALAWIAAIAEGIPQAAVFTSMELQASTQCTTVFRRSLYDECISNIKRQFGGFANKTIVVPYFVGCIRKMTIGERLYGVSHLLTIFWIPFLIICTLYAVMLLKMRTVKADHNDQKSSAGLLSRQRKRQMGNVKRVLLITISYIVCWLPYNTIALTELLLPEYFAGSGFIVSEIVTDLMVVNCIVNPILYKIKRK